ncbi:MAG: glycosyltransferase family 39 protein [Planctomycetes bacterium]|nr:glycosyltransferase family 39 protein [Planctomycetota bacterium]
MRAVRGSKLYGLYQRYGDPLALLLVGLVMIGCLVLRQDQGVVPHDTGTLCQSAVRVLNGELPHRDYDELYTGALSFFHAASFWLLGVHTSSIRWAFVLTSTCWAWGVYLVARRATSIPLALLVTATAVLWSVPNYFSPMPSWYNLFFATFGVLALLQFIDRDQRRWLVLAGVCGGLSLCVKLIGLYYVAAVGLFLVYRSQALSIHSTHLAHVEQPVASSPVVERASRNWWLGASGVTLLLSLFVVMLGELVRYHPNLMEVAHFALPGVMIAFWLMIREWQFGGRDSGARHRRLTLESLWFAAGICLPIAVLLVPYVWTGSVDSLIRGVFIQPMKRLSDDSMIFALPSAQGLMWLIPLVGVVGGTLWARRGLTHPAMVLAVGLLLAYGVAVAGESRTIYQGFWYMARGAAPVLVLLGVYMLGTRRFAAQIDLRGRQRLMLLIAVAALITLVQVPISNGIYFLYAAPMVVLAGLYVVRYQPAGIQPLHMAAGAAALLFAGLWVVGGFPHAFGIRYIAMPPLMPLGLERSNLAVDDQCLQIYTNLVRIVQEHSPAGSYVYAVGDCPEVCFFADRKNPTRTFFEAFDDDIGTQERVDRIIRTLREKDVQVVVIKGAAHFAGAAGPRLRAALSREFPQTFDLFWRTSNRAPAYTVRWRDESWPREATPSPRDTDRLATSAQEAE